MLVIDGEKYLVEKEASVKYGLSPHWFRRARYSGNSPKYHKLNGRIYYKEAQIDEWLKDHLKEVNI